MTPVLSVVAVSTKPIGRDLPMNRESIEVRLATLEAEVARLRATAPGDPSGKKAWWLAISGCFRRDAAFAEAMKLGRKYRQGLRTKSSRRTKGGHGRS